MTRHDDGLSLAELMMAAAITAVIVPVVTGALVVGWRTSDDTIARLADTRDRQLVPSMFTRDVQSTQVVATTGAGCLQAGDTLVVRFTMAEPQDSTTPAATRTAAWVLTAGQLLERRWCLTGSTVASSVTLAHGVMGTPSVTCRLTAGGSAQACGAGTKVVDLSVTDASGAFTATGRRRS